MSDRCYKYIGIINEDYNLQLILADSLRDLLKRSGLEIAKKCNNQCIVIVEMHDYLKGKKKIHFSLSLRGRPQSSTIVIRTRSVINQVNVRIALHMLQKLVDCPLLNMKIIHVK